CRIVILFKRVHPAIPETKDLNIATVVLYVLVTPTASSLDIDLTIGSRHNRIGIFPRNKFVDKPIKSSTEIIKNGIPEFFYGIPPLMDSNGTNSNIVRGERGYNLRLFITPKRVKFILVFQIERKKLNNGFHILPRHLTFSRHQTVKRYTFDYRCHPFPSPSINSLHFLLIS